MKRFKKELSLLLTVALVISSLVIGLGQLQASAVTQATGQIASYRYEVKTAGQDCNGTGTANNCVVTIYYTDGSNWQTTIAGEASTNYFEAGNTDNIYFSNVPAKPISSLQIDSQGGDRWKEDWGNLYYSPDSGTTWLKIATMGGFDGTGVRGFTYPSDYSLNTSSLNKTLTFDANGGTGGTQIYSEYGATLPAGNIPTVTRTGYTFNGWSPSVPATGPSADTTYTAQWTPQQYIISFSGNGATSGSMASIVCYYGDIISIPPNNLTRTGYSFSGWATSASGSVVYSDGMSYTVTGSATLYAKWTANTYTIAYNGNGNTGGSTPNSTHYYDTAKNLNANGFMKTGYTFAGWSTTAGGPLAYTDGQSVSNLTATNGGTVTLYAKWTPYTYYVSYDPVYPDVSGTTPSSEHTIGVPSSLSSNNFYRTGYTYQGWARSGGLIVSDSSDLDSLVSYNGQTIALYASWDANTYTIYFNGNGATSGYMPPVTFRYDDMFNFPPNSFSRTGYTFVGWALSPTGPVVYVNQANIVNLTTGGSITLYAKWTAITYTITYNGNGSTGGSMSNSIHTYDIAKNLNTNGYSKTGHTFLGWALTRYATEPTWENQESVLNLTSINGATVTFYAVWQTNYYNITFDANGGTGGTGPTAMLYGSPFTEPTVTKIGYDFAGWTPNVPATVPAADTTYVAQWNIKSYEVYFDCNGGTCGGNGYHTMQYGEPITPPVCTRTGYTFMGWSPSIPATMPAANATYVAQWSINTYTAYFDCNGGTCGGNGIHPIQYNSAIVPPTCTRTGYTFIGWSPSIPATMPASDVTYVAQWSINQYTINFETNGGTPVTPVTADYGTSVSEPAPPTRAGYNFIGWYTDIGLTVPVSWPYTLGAANVTFYAKWTVAYADYSEVDELISIATAATLPASPLHDAPYLPGGDMYMLGGFTNNGFYPREMFIYADAILLNQAVGGVVFQLDITQQPIVDGYADSIRDALNNLVLKPADYSVLDNLVADAEGLNRYICTEDSLNMLDAALVDAYDTMAAAYKMPLQVIVDDRTDALQNALNNMEYLLADYSEVEYIWANKPANLYTAYTPESVANLVDYYNYEIVWNLMADQQVVVDGYAYGLAALISALELKPADYGDVDDALRAIPDNDGGQISIDWNYLYAHYTNSSVTNLANAVNNVVGGKYINEQTVVDGYAWRIYAAIADLEPLNADYTYLAIALYMEPDWPSSYYTQASYNPYNSAKAAGWELYNNQNLSIFEQNIINDATALINSTYAALELKPVTYTIKYQTAGGVTILTQGVKNGTAGDWVIENAAAITGYTPTQATQQMRLTGTSVSNIIIFTYSANSYAITFDANGGMGGTGPTSMLYGSPLTAPAVTKTGYDFAGWSPSVPLTVPAADTTYEAQWTISIVYITWDPNGGKWDDGTSEPKTTTDLEWSWGLTRTGYAFAGWSPAVPATMPAENETFIAQWTSEPPYFIFDPPFEPPIEPPEPPFIVDGEFIYGLSEGMTQADFEALCAGVIVGNGSLEITTLGGSFGTGTKVKLIDNANEDVVGTWYIVIFGDINGDGTVGSTDADLINFYENFIIEWDPDLEGYLFFATDLNGDGNSDAQDADIINFVENFQAWIDQQTGQVFVY